MLQDQRTEVCPGKGDVKRREDRSKEDWTVEDQRPVGKFYLVIEFAAVVRM
jgi:hypothetical protein